MSTDNIQRFIFENENIRGEIVHLEATYQAIINQRPYPPIVQYLLGEALISALLLASSVKFEGSLSLQFQGGTALSMLLVQVDHNLNVRAMAKYEEGLDDKIYASAFLKGQMVITIQADKQSKAYQSIVPLVSTAMSENLANYFIQSEQIATRVWLASNGQQAAGMLLQLMPGESTLEREHFWEYALAMGETVTEKELLELDNITLLHRLYHETEIRIFEPRIPQFQCRCSAERMKQALTLLNKTEVESLLKEKEGIEIRCEFCNQCYTFDAIDVAMMFHHKDN